jgi:hypothetical protein
LKIGGCVINIREREREAITIDLKRRTEKEALTSMVVGQTRVFVVRRQQPPSILPCRVGERKA